MTGRKKAPAEWRDTGLLLVVGWQEDGSVAARRPVGPLHSIIADMSRPMPDPPLTDSEMQPVVFAAKMALHKVLAQRKAQS